MTADHEKGQIVLGIPIKGNYISFDDDNQHTIELSGEVCFFKIYCFVLLVYICTVSDGIERKTLFWWISIGNYIG